MTQEIFSGDTWLDKSQRQASMPVLPAPITTYCECGALSVGKSFSGISVASLATSYLGGVTEGTDTFIYVASTTFCATTCWISPVTSDWNDFSPR